jgi:hypothetical protein
MKKLTILFIAFAIFGIMHAQINLSAEKLTGPIYGKVGDNLAYAFTVKNNASTASGTNYEVFLFNGTQSLATPQPGISIAPGGTHVFTFTWNTTGFSTTTHAFVTALVEWTGGESETTGFRVDILPASAEFRYIGNATNPTWDEFYPISYYSGTSISQTIYTESQIGFTGTITHLAYDFRGHGDVPANIPVEIYMGLTTKSGFATGGTDWIPTNQMTKVFEGSLPVDVAGEREIAFRLNTPFAYTGGNIVVMAFKPMQSVWYDEANQFKTTNLAAPRTMQAYHDTTPINLSDLPPGIVWSYIANIKIMITNPTVEDIDVVIEEPKPTIAKNSLLPNYPNPFNPSTTISFDNVVEGNVRIDIFNVKGQRITTLTNQHYGIGLHKLVWEGRDDFGTQVGSGVYLYRMTSENHSETRRMILMK